MLVRLAAVNVSAWEAIFMLVVLKIPMIYLGAVVWWAVRAVPEPASGGEDLGVLEPVSPPCGWSDWQRRRIKRPAGGSPRARQRRAAMRVAAR